MITSHIVITSIYVNEESLCAEQSRLVRDGQITARETGRTRGKVEEDTETLSMRAQSESMMTEDVNRGMSHKKNVVERASE
jgi:hypothetical protein